MATRSIVIHGYQNASAAIPLRREEEQELNNALDKLKLETSQKRAQLKLQSDTRKELHLLSVQKECINDRRSATALMNLRSMTSDSTQATNLENDQFRSSSVIASRSSPPFTDSLKNEAAQKNTKLAQPIGTQNTICDLPNSASIITELVFQKNYCTPEETSSRNKTNPNLNRVGCSAPAHTTRRRIYSNSIKYGARRKNGQFGLDKRPRTTQDVSTAGRSLRTLQQITHIEAIAASDIQRRREEWQASQEERKLRENRNLQKKVDDFIEKIENDKRVLQAKMKVFTSSEPLN